MKKVLLEILQNLQENFCARVSFLIKLQACNFIKKEALAQVFSCEFCEISKNAFLTKHFWNACISRYKLAKAVRFDSLSNLVFAFYQSSVFIDFDNTVYNENEKDGFIVSRKSYSIKL